MHNTCDPPNFNIVQPQCLEHQIDEKGQAVY
jgi:hypothetical protein